MKALHCLTLALSLGVIMCSRKDPEASGHPPSARESVPATPPVPGSAGGPPSPANPSAGATGAAGDASGPEQPRTLSFALGGDSVHILKVADAGHLPAGAFLGEKAFRAARQGASGGKILIHVVVPNALGQADFRHRAGGRTTALEAIRYIFRNPTSPRHTFAIVDADDPGRIEGTTKNGVSGGIDLGPLADALRAMPFHWDRPDSGRVTYQGLPASLSGRMPR